MDVRAICGTYQSDPASLIEILHDVQGEHGFVPESALVEIADALNLTRAEVFGVTSYYDDFRFVPAAKTIVKICKAEACQAMGANALFSTAKEQFRTEVSVDVEAVYCLGNCALAPAAMINGALVGQLGIEKLGKLVEKAKS